jgi:Dyp-type peroxidase family
MTLQSALFDQVQANILTGYPRAYCARFLLCEVLDKDQAVAWLQNVAPLISYEREQPKPGYRLNIGFTYAGLRRLGVTDAELFGASSAFVEGLTRRAHLLGAAQPPQDRDSTWDDRPLHMAVLLYADFTDRHDEQSRRLFELLVANGSYVRAADGVAHKQHARELAELVAQFLDETEQAVLPALPDGGLSARRRDLHHSLVADPHAPGQAYPIEYFGFRDGVRNPRPLEESVEACREFVVSSPEPLLEGGSYLVLRELHQDVESFWSEIRQAAGDASPVELAERVIGRRRDGRPLDAAAPGGLSFVPGSSASGCPFASHVRRANPEIEAGRGANPRLIRRGLSYRDAEGQCGLMFMAFMSDIEEQFEFIQKNWVQRANHVGQLSAHFDAVAGSTREAPPPRTQLALGSGRALSLSQFVHPGHGAYLFVPARRALQRIAHDPSARGVADKAESPVASALARLESPAEKLALIQSWLDQSDAGARFWRFVERQERAELAIGSYVFIADPERVLKILGDDGKTYSVGEYMARMRPSTGEFMLGRDVYTDEYQREKATLKVLDDIVPEQIAGAAALTVERVVDQRAFLQAFSNDPQGPIRLELRTLIAAVLDRVIGTFFGLPGASTASLAIWGRATARYHFRPIPDASDRAKAIQASQEYRCHVMQLLAEANAGPPDGAGALKRAQTTIRNALNEVLPNEILPKHAQASDDDVVRNLVGIVTGALGATMKLFFEGFTLYVREHARGRKLDWAHMQESDQRWKDFVKLLQKERRGGPDVLYRQLPEQVEGGTPKLAVLWVGGAQGKSPDRLFGVGPHACPGKNIGIAMIEGLLRALIALEETHHVEYEGEYEELRLELKPRLGLDQPGAHAGGLDGPGT